VSYILEALKRSQLARERQQIPRVPLRLHWERETVSSQQRWGVLALVVASLALVVALLKSPPAPLFQRGEISDGIFQRGEKLDGIAQSEERLNGIAQSEERLNGIVQRGEKLDGIVQSEERLNGIVQSELDKAPALVKGDKASTLVKEDNAPPLANGVGGISQRRETIIDGTALEKPAPVDSSLEKVAPISPLLEKEFWGDFIAPPPPKLRPTLPVEKEELPIAAPVKKPAPPAPSVVNQNKPKLEPRRNAAPADDYPNPNLDPMVEQQLEAALPFEEINDEQPTPIPPDLIQEIEAFKQQIKREKSAHVKGQFEP
jgi:hypothetical protein